MRTTKQRPAAVRLWEKVNKTETCWIWMGGLDTTGYGRLRRPRRDVREDGGSAYWPAHRLAYELEAGPIPEGMDLDHLCRTRKCVNPSHLEPVSRRVNVLRGVGISAVNAAKTECIRGHQFDDVNTRFKRRANGAISRDCKRCDADRAAQRRRAAKSSTQGDAS